MSQADPATREAPVRVVAIVNPLARRAVDAVRQALLEAAPPGSRVDLLVSTAVGDATRLARSVLDNVDLIVAVGGDGTVSEVTTGVVGTSIPVAIIPAGSTNIVARELAIPTDLKAAVRLVFGPHRLVSRDLGRCGERYFLHMAGAGLDARFFKRTSRELKRHFGWLAYLPAAAQALGEPPATMTVRADEATVKTESPLVLVANGGSIIHPAMQLHPAIRSDDGWLDVFVFKRSDLIALARTLVHFTAGQPGELPETEVLRARRVDIRAHPAVPVQLDGDPIGTTPVSIEVVPDAVRLVAPLS